MSQKLNKNKTNKQTNKQTAKQTKTAKTYISYSTSQVKIIPGNCSE